VKLLDNFFVYNKKDKKYLSKGDGYLSIEFMDDSKNKNGVFVFRNKMGNKMFDGLISATLDKIEKNVRNFKHTATLSTIHKNPTSGQFEGTFIKVPFAREEDLEEFEKSF